MSDIDKLYQQLVETVKKHNPDADMQLIERAYQFAADAHKPQRRLSGEPYIIHPIHVAINLATLNMDSRAIAAGFLHDVLEDTKVTSKDIEKEFGKEICKLVEGVSKLRKIRFKEKSQYIENLRKMFVATAKDIRVIIIKLCDRLHNMQTLEYAPTEQQIRVAQETLEIYAPLAHRLQIGSFRGQLEDWAFKFLHPEEYRWLYNVTRKNYTEREALLKKTEGKVRKMLSKEGIEVTDIKKRTKFLYSLYRKLQRYDNDLSRIYDIVAIRVIVPKISDCYAALGIIHREFKPLKGRIKDYIARPKSNGYTSLHTTVMLKDGDIIEIQIRTPDMDDKAELGIAAHWQYKEQGEYTRRQIQVSWAKEMAKIMKNIQAPQDLESVKLDMFEHRIFVLTPKADVIDLPEDSTPIDFAYHIHTDLGNQVTNAKVNGKISQLSTKLQNGDIVEIIVDKQKKGPDIEWLDFVKTNLAKSKVKYYNRKKLADWEKNLRSTELKKK